MTYTEPRKDPGGSPVVTRKGDKNSQNYQVQNPTQEKTKQYQLPGIIQSSYAYQPGETPTTLALTQEREARQLAALGLHDMGLPTRVQNHHYQYYTYEDAADFLQVTNIEDLFQTTNITCMDRNNNKISFRAIIDSAATANFISPKIIEQIQHKELDTYCPPVRDVNRNIIEPASTSACKEVDFECPLSKGNAISRFRVMPLRTGDIILGLPWLQQHNPKIDWKSGKVPRNENDASQAILDALNFLNLTSETDEEAGSLPKEESIILALSFLALTEDGRSNRGTTQAAPRRIPDAYWEYALLWSEEEAEKLPPHRPGIDHKIVFREGFRPKFGPLYNLSEHELEVLRKYITKMLALGFIRHSKSEAGAPLLFVHKRGSEELRPCVDFRDVNSGTIPNRYPIPLISEILNRLGKAKVFTKLDLRGAYNLIRIHPGDEWKTAFRTRFGSFEYLVLPFGLCNAPATFQAYIDQCLREFVDKSVIVYLDDILIFSENEEEHEDHVKQVLAKLLEWRLFCKLEKCRFSVKEVEFLGYIVSDQGIAMDQARVSSITEWPTPKSIREVLSFLGFCNFYRRFICSYSDIALPMTNSTKGGKKFQWTKNCDEAFITLKNAFTKAPLLCHFVATSACFLETDASIRALCGILSQIQEDTHKHPIAFYSRKLIPAEVNYTTFDQELLAIIESIKHWRHFLEGAQHKVTIISDHNNLKHFTTSRTLTRRQARWAVVLSTIDFVIVHRPGKRNPADGPSRRADYQSESAEPKPLLRLEGQTIDSLLLLNGQPDILNLITATAKVLVEEGRTHTIKELKEMDENRFDAERSEILATLQAEETPEGILGGAQEEPRQQQSLTESIKLCQQAHADPTGLEFSLKDGLWYYDGTRLFIPTDKKLQKELLTEFHDSPTAGHFGKNRTISAMKRILYWQGMDADIEDYVRSCLACQRYKPSHITTAGELAPIPIPDKPWSGIALDMITDLPVSRSKADFSSGAKENMLLYPAYDAILNITCRMTKEAKFLPCRKDMTSIQFAHLFLREVFAEHGMPDSIITDRAGLFTSTFWAALTSHLGTTRKLSTAFHPQTDGSTEKLNQVIEAFLRMYINHEQDDWADLLYLAEYAHNSTPVSGTKLAPFEANGKEIPPFQIQTVSKHKSGDAQQLAKRLKDLHRQLIEDLTHAQNLQAKYYDAKHRPLTFKAGDQVWLSCKNLTTNRKCEKLGPKKLGPFKIVESIGLQSYKIKLPASYKCHNVFHVSLLTPHRTAMRVDRSEDLADPPAAEIVANKAYGDEAPEWEVEKILDSRIYGRWRKLQYKVRWKGYSQDEDSWQSPEDLENAGEEIDSFHKEHPFAPGGVGEA